MTTTITFANFKGGSGKTTNSCLVSYILSKKGYRTLLVDLDPQGNATSLMLKTKQHLDDDITVFNETLMSAIGKGNLSPIITKINSNLDLLPSYVDFSSYPRYTESILSNYEERQRHFNNLLNPLKINYDFIIIDVPPTISLFTDSALVASDYAIIVLQTQQRASDGTNLFITQMAELKEHLDLNLSLLGILPVLHSNRSAVDQLVLAEAKNDFGDLVFNSVVNQMERLKRYDIYGINDPKLSKKYDVHDVKVFEFYNKLTNEILERIDL